MCTPSMSYRFTTSLSTAMKCSTAAGSPGSNHRYSPYLRTIFCVRHAGMIGRRLAARARHTHAVRIEPHVQLQARGDALPRRRTRADRKTAPAAGPSCPVRYSDHGSSFDG